MAWIPADIFKYYGTPDLGAPIVDIPIKKAPQGMSYPPFEYPYFGFYPLVVRGKTSDGETDVV